MQYGISCKPEYFNSWTFILAAELSGIATVEVVSPACMRTVPNDTRSIVSPSGKYAVAIHPCNDEFIRVFVVSDGGYLMLLGHFSESKDGTHLHIGIDDWKCIEKQVFNDMEDRTRSVLSNMFKREEFKAT